MATGRRRLVSFATAAVCFACWTGGGSRGETGMMTEEVARRVVEEIAPEVERLRGLRFKESVEVSVVDDASIREYIVERLREFDYEERLQAATRAYELLGLVPPGIDLLEALLRVMEEQAGGFYDPPRRSYYLLDDMPVGVAPVLTAHELTHALEDQHFDLDGRLRRVTDNDDMVFAASAVHEGSATLLMGAYLMQAEDDGGLAIAEAMGNLAALEGPELARLPPLLTRQLLGPYLLGVPFLTRGNLREAADGYPAAAVDRAYRDSPTSSEQILHPDKYWDERLRDEPRAVDLGGSGKLLGEQWEVEGDGVLGELTLGVLVGAETPMHLGRDGGESHRAAEGERCDVSHGFHS